MFFLQEFTLSPPVFCLMQPVSRKITGIFHYILKKLGSSFSKCRIQVINFLFTGLKRHTHTKPWLQIYNYPITSLYLPKGKWFNFHYFIITIF